MSSEPKECSKESQVSKELNAMGIAIDNLVGNINTIEDCLSTVMREIPPEEIGKTPQTAIAIVPLADIIRGFRCSIEKQSSRIENFSKRLEL